MVKYKVTPYISPLGNIRYGVDMRFFLILWVPVKSFLNKQESIDYCNKLNEKIIINN